MSTRRARAGRSWTAIPTGQFPGRQCCAPGLQDLLADAARGRFEVILAEGLDRLSRDQEDTARIFKQLNFAGIQLFTVAEGEIGELHIGFKSTLNALYLKDLAAKTRRGMRGRVEAGKSGGGLCYGYAVRRSLNADATLSTGDREILPAEAETICRVFRGVCGRQITSPDRHWSQPRQHPRPWRRGLGAKHDQRQPEARHRYPEQRTLYWPPRVEPAALCKGSGHRQARLPDQ